MELNFSMIIKKLSIPLCDLRLKSDFEETKDFMVNEKTSNETDLGLTAASMENKRTRNLRNQVETKEETEEEVETYEMKKVQVRKKKIVKILDVNPKKEDKRGDSNSEEEDSEISNFEEEDDLENDPDYDEEYEEENEKRSRSHIKEEERQEIKVPRVERKLSAYEQMIQKNREEKMAFLQSLKIQEAKTDLLEVVDSVKKKKPQSVKRKYEKAKSEISPPVLRKSRRLANLNVDLSEDALFENAVKTAQSYEEPKKTIPPEMSFKEALADEEFYERFVTEVNIKESKSETKFVTYDKSDLKKMTVRDSSIAKVTPSRITALAWYPSPEQLIVAAGDKYGNLGVWNVVEEFNPYVLKIHLEGITNLQFSPFNPVHLFSSSYDGILRCGDMVQHKFNEVYNISDESCCTYFDILSATTFLVAQKNGQVALVDRRTEGKSCEKKHVCHDYSVKTVNIHPVNRNFFLTAENKGSIRLWDLRKLQKNPVADISYHKRCVHSAYFSPVTGNSILATSIDDTVSIFDSTKLTSEIKLKQRMKHDNKTGRWLSVFKATWLPNSEEAFVIGSMQYPRRIEVYDKNMFAYNVMMHENFTCITSTNAFHPTRPALAGGNSSGKVFVFM